MSRRRDEDRYSRYDDRDHKSQAMRARSRGRDRSEDGNDLWDSQFIEPAGFPRAPPAPSFSHENTSNYSTSYPSYTGIYDEFPSLGNSGIPAPPQPPSIQWNQLMLPPAPETVPPPATAIQNLEEQIKKEEAIESEVRHQKATLAKQREEYTRKAAILKKELETLKDQRDELRGDSKRSPSPDSKRFLKENAKLQLEIQNKLKTINNVVDMLNGIIGEKPIEPVAKKRESEHPGVSPERTSSKRKSRSPPTKDKKFNYVYYDPEMHWCRICNEFPPTAKDYLNHLHSAQHHKTAAAHLEAPWHGKPNTNEGLPNYPNAPTKRTPIRGLQFFVPSTAWYCKLCDDWIGDLHCASAHLKSLAHSKNYTNFVEQNPHWETDWMSDRQKAFEKSRTSAKTKMEDKQYTAHTITFDKDGFTKKKKEKSLSPGTPEQEKKKKKKKRVRSSSSSSSSDSDRRSREKKGKKINDKSKESRDDKVLEQWIECQQLTDKERKMLENLKNSIRGDKGKRDTRDRQRERDRERERERVAQVAQMKRQEAREDREKRDERERDKNKERGDKDSGGHGDKKPNETRKMPFIGKMPVFKSLTKPVKSEEMKDSEKKQEDEVAKKRRQEIDAEIQRKVAEFKLKMQTRVEVGPPGVAHPTSLGAFPATPNFPQTIHRVQKEAVLVSGPVMGPPSQPAPIKATPSYQVPPPINQGPAPTNQAPPPTNQNPPPLSSQQKKQIVPNSKGKGPLHRDFQEALDIIFPSEKKSEPPIQPNEHMDMNMMFSNMGGPGMPPFGPPMGPFGPPMGMMPPQMNGPPHMMMGYDFNQQQMFGGPGPPQLYDRQVPIEMQGAPGGPPPAQPPTPHRQSARQKEENKKSEMEDLAMLGIDAADVGACIS